jgi:hypothetical protein
MTQDKGPNSEIALTFYAVFRRFEIALRKAGYSNSGGPDWETFLHEIEGRYNPQAAPELYGAVLTLVDKYPRHFHRSTVAGAARDLRALSVLVRELGNDLTRNMMHRRYTSEHDETFMACLILLQAWSDLEPNLKRALSETK